jgi:hypothetical protein
MARRPKILSEGDRQWFESMGGKSWMKTSAFKGRQGPRYTKTLDTFVDAVAALGFSDPLDGARLRGLLEAMLSSDGSFGSYFRERKAATLEKDESWERLWSVCAGALVERYLAQRDVPPKVTPALLFDEDLREEVGKLVDLAIAEGEASAKEGLDAKEELITPGGAPDVVEAARSRLEELFSADLNVAHESTAEGIPEEERELEIAKSALLDLQMSKLRKIAEAEELPTLGKREAIATLIARKYKSGRREIAELILKYAADDPEHGYTTRLLPLADEPDLPKAAERLAGLKGRYMRVDVANWVVFNSVYSQTNLASFSGEVRYYNVATQEEGNDPEITARQRSGPISVRLRSAQTWGEVDTRNLTEVRRIRAALSHATGAEVENFLPVKLPALSGDAATFDRHTLLILHLLDNLRDPHLDFVSFTMASFSAGTDPGAEADPLRPRIRQVRLSGQHLLASRDACRLIATGSRLVAVEFRAKYKKDLTAKEAHFSTVQIGIGPDHASILTSFGGNPGMARSLHTDLVGRVREGLDRDVPDPAELQSIVSQVTERAAQEGEAETADILGPEESPVDVDVDADASPPSQDGGPPGDSGSSVSGAAS